MSNTPCEGDIFAVVTVGGHDFTVRYGYYDESERSFTEPIPIYPCFIENPRYTPEGKPLITRMQDACEHYNTGNTHPGEGWCSDCIHCSVREHELGVCECPQRQIPEQNS